MGDNVIIMTAEGLTRRLRPLLGIMQVGNLVNFRPRNQLCPTAVRVDSQNSGGQSTLRITNRLAAGSQNHEFQIKNNTFWLVSVLLRRSTYSREGTDVNLGQIFKI